MQFQAFLYTELIKRAALQGVAFPGVPITQSTDKAMRIISLQPHFKNGLIRLHRSQSVLVEQLKFWPEADHDDGPDALEMLQNLATQFGGEFKYTGAGSMRGFRNRQAVNVGFDGDDWDED